MGQEKGAIPLWLPLQNQAILTPNFLPLLSLLTAISFNLVQEGRRQEAEGRRKESLYSKLFNLFQLDSYFRHAALDPHKLRIQ
jgi:hypothetical protein